MVVTASALRADIYRILDRVIETGEPVEIVRKGCRLRIVPEAPTAKLDRLVCRSDAVVGDSAELIHLDWSGEWKA